MRQDVVTELGVGDGDQVVDDHLHRGTARLGCLDARPDIHIPGRIGQQQGVSLLKGHRRLGCVRWLWCSASEWLDGNGIDQIVQPELLFWIEQEPVDALERNDRVDQRPDRTIEVVEIVKARPGLARVQGGIGGRVEIGWIDDLKALRVEDHGDRSIAVLGRPPGDVLDDLAHDPLDTGIEKIVVIEIRAIDIDRLHDRILTDNGCVPSVGERTPSRGALGWDGSRDGGRSQRGRGAAHARAACR